MEARFGISESARRLRLAAEFVSDQNSEHFIAVGVVGSVVRGEATKGSDIDLYIIERTNAKKIRVETKSFKGVKVQLTYLPVTYIRNVLKSGWTRDLGEYRIFVRMREIVLFFTRDAGLTTQIRYAVRGVRASPQMVTNIFNTCKSFLADAKDLYQEHQIEMAVVALRASIECVKLLVFIIHNEDIGGRKLDISKMRLLDARICDTYVDMIRNDRDNTQKRLRSLRHLCKEMAKKVTSARREELEILEDIYDDASDMLLAKRELDALAIIQECAFVFYLPKFKMHPLLRANSSLHDALKCAAGIQNISEKNYLELEQKAHFAHELLIPLMKNSGYLQL